ncbi:Proline iminopeptidase, partial [Cucurbita argyrosperma subsp. argyrosperma]
MAEWLNGLYCGRFERAWDPIIVPGAPKRISFFFLNEIDNWIPFGSNPLYALLNESVYCQGASSRWSAERIRNEVGSKFDANKAVKDGFPVYFTGEVPVAAAVYYEDMFVNFKLTMETASQIGGTRLWITNELMHSGLRDAGPQVVDQLMGLLNGKKPLF